MAITKRLNGSMAVSGLSAGANTIPHGLPCAPVSINLRPNVEDRIAAAPNQFWTMTAPADATNFYVTLSGSAPTSGVIDFWLPAT